VEKRLKKTRISTLLLLICVGASAHAVEGSLAVAASGLRAPIDSETFKAAAIHLPSAGAVVVAPAHEAMRVFLVASVVFVLLVFYRCRR
jgi:hypothetical protein